jgi:hypothetical protein
MHVEEIRSLHELKHSLANNPASIALIEVRHANVGDTLMWLDENITIYSRACFVALFDGEGMIDYDSGVVSDALLAAGAVTIAESPRQLQRIVRLGERHAAIQRSAPPWVGEKPSFSDWARSLLPWQAP